MLRRSRLLEEDVRFGLVAQDEAGPGPEHADGLLAASIKAAGRRILPQDLACTALTAIARQMLSFELRQRSLCFPGSLGMAAEHASTMVSWVLHLRSPGRA